MINAVAIPLAAQEPALGFLLVEAARLYRARIERAFDEAGLGLTSGEARTLAYVNAHPGLRQNALAEKMNVEPMTLVGFLDRLEAEGLLVREADKKDRRCKIVVLTAAAAPYLDAISSTAGATRGEATEGFSAEETIQLRRLLLRLRDNLALGHRARDER